MQVDSRFQGTNEEQQENLRTALAPTRASVWIDPVEQHNVSTCYVEREQEEQRRRKKVVANPNTPAPSTPVPPRASAIPSSSSQLRPRALRTYMLSAPQQKDLADMPTLPPTRGRHIDHINSLRPEAEIPLRSRLHPESTVSRAKNASLSPQRAIDERDTVPFTASVSFIEQAIDEIDTILPVSPAIDEIDTLKPPHAKKRISGMYMRSISSSHSNELAIDEIDTLAPGTVTVLPPKPLPSKKRFAEMNVTIVDSRPPALPLHSLEHSINMDSDVSWTTGANANVLLKKRIASRARDKRAKHAKPLGELLLTPLSNVRWWLLYPGRMEFMLWISGALILLGVTCTLLFALLASSGLIRFGGTAATNTVLHVMNTSDTCTTPAHCQTANSPATGVSSPTSKQQGSVTLNKTPAPSTIGTTPATTLTPVSTGTSHAPAGGSPGTSTPVSQTPVPASPTVSVSPTVQPTQTTPTPTPTKTATPSPTASISPTVSVTPPGKKPTAISVQHTDTQSLSLNTALHGTPPSPGATSSTWMWLVLIGYAFSMVMLGLAALLYRRKRRLC